MSARDPSGRGTSAWVHAIRERRFETPAMKLMCMCMADYIDSNDEFWPGQVRLAGEVGTTDRTVRRMIDWLEERKVIARFRRQNAPGEGRGRAAEGYRFLWPGMARLPLCLPDTMSPKKPGGSRAKSTTSHDVQAPGLPEVVSAKTPALSGHDESSYRTNGAALSGQIEPTSSFRTPQGTTNENPRAASPAAPPVGPAEVEHLCEDLAQRVAAHRRTGVPAITQRWRVDMERLVRLGPLHGADLRPMTVARVHRALAVTFEQLADPGGDGFCWADQIRSPYALRDHWHQIRLALERRNQVAPPRPSDPAVDAQWRDQLASTLGAQR